MRKCPECGCTEVKEVTWLNGEPGVIWIGQGVIDDVKNLAEAELDQCIPAKDAVVGSNPTNETCPYCGKQGCEHQKAAWEHLKNIAR